MEKIEAVGYIVQDKDGHAIFGIGATADEAWRETVDAVGYFHDLEDNAVSPENARDTQFLTYPATASLLAMVEKKGGAISWDIVDGVACACDENENRAGE